MARVAKLNGVPFRSLVVVPRVLTYHLIDGTQTGEGEAGDVTVVPEIAGRVLNSERYTIPAAVVAGLIESGGASDAEIPTKK